MSRKTLLIAMALLPAACSREAGTPADNESIVTTPAPARAEPSASKVDYTGRWTGVEGMFLDVAPGATPGAYRLTMQYDLDHKGSFDATRDGDTLNAGRTPAACRRG